MFRIRPQLIARPAVARAVVPRAAPPARRYISTAPPTQKSRSWKSLVARVGIAGTLIYYYNTTDVFAEEPRRLVQPLPETDSETETLPTIESISAERKERRAVQAQLDAQAQKEAESKQQNAQVGSGAEGGIEGLEEEADQQGAFNPETGEINWDCPCLGGMAHGPCGEEFRAAFSCFVYSQEEPKGMDCIDKFKNMQNCFRQYPEVYGSELEADAEDDDNEVSPSDLPASAESTPSTSTSTSTDQSAPPKASAQPPSTQPHSAEKVLENRRELGLVPQNYKPDSEEVVESERIVPKAAFNTEDATVGKAEEKKGKKSE